MDKDKLESRVFEHLILGLVLFFFGGILSQVAKFGVVSGLLIPISAVVLGVSAALIFGSVVLLGVVLLRR